MSIPRAYGWRRQSPDHRDYRFSAPQRFIQDLPPRVDLRDTQIPIYDQGRIGSCTANAIAGALQYCQVKDNVKTFTPSRLFIYWNERNIEGTVESDAGAIIRDGIKVVNQVGAPAEKHWSYDDTPADQVTGKWSAGAKPRQKPNCFAYRHAKDADAVAYLAVDQTVDQLRSCLAQGFPIVFGFTVYDSFESQDVAMSGVMYMPKASEKVLGGHAVLMVGYDDGQQRFIVRNSWGDRWGQAGHFTMPYEYAARADLAADFWSIRQV